MLYQLQFKVSTSDQLDQIQSSIQQMPDVKDAIFNVIESPTMTPNDPCAWGILCFYAGSFQSVGDLNRWGLEFVKAPAAWDIQTGSASVVVGVIDVDIDSTHSDLKNNVQASIGSRTGGYAGHGTHVTGTIGAVGNNGIGIAGMAWQTSLRLYDWGSALGGVVERMIEAARDNARIVNISAGAGLPASYINGNLVCPPNPPAWTRNKNSNQKPRSIVKQFNGQRATKKTCSGYSRPAMDVRMPNMRLRLI